MRATILALLLSLPLLAGDRSPLAKAVELFESPDAGQREAGSQLARNELQKLLAPLLAAMKHEDPEVRRRARRAILALVPGELEKEDQRTAPQLPQRAAQLRARQMFLRQLVQGQQANAQALAKLAQRRNQARENAGAAALRAFGVSGKARRRAPLQPGFLVKRVKPNSAAARLGLRTGDIIVKVDGRATSRFRDFASVEDWRHVRILVLRGKQYVYVPPRNARR